MSALIFILDFYIEFIIRGWNTYSMIFIALKLMLRIITDEPWNKNDLWVKNPGLYCKIKCIGRALFFVWKYVFSPFLNYAIKIVPVLILFITYLYCRRRNRSTFISYFSLGKLQKKVIKYSRYIFRPFEKFEKLNMKIFVRKRASCSWKIYEYNIYENFKVSRRHR